MKRPRREMGRLGISAGGPGGGALLCRGTLWMIGKCEPLRRCWDDWRDQNIKVWMMDQLSPCVSLAERWIEAELLSRVTSTSS